MRSGHPGKHFGPKIVGGIGHSPSGRGNGHPAHQSLPRSDGSLGVCRDAMAAPFTAGRPWLQPSFALAAGRQFLPRPRPHPPVCLGRVRAISGRKAAAGGTGSQPGHGTPAGTDGRRQPHSGCLDMEPSGGTRAAPGRSPGQDDPPVSAKCAQRRQKSPAARFSGRPSSGTSSLGTDLSDAALAFKQGRVDRDHHRFRPGNAP
jgi:hypothetical protein